MTKKIDEVINKIIVELDIEQANYQQLYYKFHQDQDVTAKLIYDKLIFLCERIRREMK